MEKKINSILDDTPPHILVSGHSGAGKSTLAKALAAELHMPMAQVDRQPEFNEFLAQNTPDNHLPTGAPKHEEFRKLLQDTALKTIQDAKEPSVIEGAQLAHLPPELLAKFRRIHVNPSLRQTYQQRMERTKRRYLKDPEKEWTPEVEAEKRRVADLVFAHHRDTMQNYGRMAGTVKYKPGQDIKDLIAKITAAELAVRNSDRQIGSEKQSQTPAPAAKFIANADLMGSRGRAKMYGRPEPEGRDHDYIAFTDDVKQQKRFREMLTTLAQKHGYKLRQRPGGFLTASGNDTDLSFYPTAKRDDIHKAWALQEAGMSKDDAWAKIEAEKQAELLPEIQLQEHQQRIADRISTSDPRLLVYHGLGSGKSLSSLAAAEAAKEQDGEEYGVVVPASLRGNFDKEIQKFTQNSNPEIMSYTGLALGKKFQKPPSTLIMDEAHRLRNPGSASSAGAAEAAAQAKRLMLLTGSPITNSPTDLANLLSMLHNKQITPEEFEKRYIDYKTVRPGLFGWLRGVKPGVKPVVKNEKELRQLLAGKVDYQPSKTPEGVDVKEEVVRVPLSPAQDKIQKAIRTKIPPGFLWKLDQEFPLSRDELAKLNSFLTGLRQVSLSTQPFRADKDPVKAFQQSAKLQAAFQNLQKTLGEDKRKKAIIYSNFIDSGLAPYAAGLEKAKIPHAFFHGGVSPKARQAAVDAYNQGKLRALLIGPAGAEGLSTKGTSLIQLLDPHWHESRSQQARGRGLRFDSHRDLPEELKNVQVQRYLSASQDPSFLGKLMGYKRERTGDEVLEHLTAEKEQLNEIFRKILKDEGDKYRKQKEQEKQGAELPAFQPDFTPGQLHRMGVYKSLYEKEGPRLASLGEWKPEWVTEHDPKGWLEWYQNYNSGRRIPDEDARQIKRWASFKARHGGPFMANPTPRRGWALQHWAIDPAKLVSRTRADKVKTMLQAYQEQELQKYLKRRRGELTEDKEVQEKASAVFQTLKLTPPKRPLSKKKRRLLKYPDATPQPSASILDDDNAADSSK